MFGERGQEWSIVLDIGDGRRVDLIPNGVDESCLSFTQNQLSQLFLLFGNEREEFELNVGGFGFVTDKIVYPLSLCDKTKSRVNKV